MVQPIDFTTSERSNVYLVVMLSKDEQDVSPVSVYGQLELLPGWEMSESGFTGFDDEEDSREIENESGNISQ